jgi:murein DD-endopeptidase MepM/ murein hydrolase activator NlpD
MITIAALNNNKTKSPSGDGVVIDDPSDDTPIDDPSDDTPVDDETPLVFVLPVSNSTISQDYSMAALVYHKTLNRWFVHNGIDFLTEAATDVVAVEAGTVEDVYTDILNGTVVKIKHNDKMTTVYKSLSDVTLTKGATVTKGQVIGKTSTSAANEADEGFHVHLEMYNTGVIADPKTLLPIEDK